MDVFKLQARISLNTDDYENALSRAVNTWDSKMTNAIKKATSAVKDFAMQSVQVGMNFDQSMSQVAATMGVTTDQVQDLRKYAQDMGATTAFSATQAADALNYMALAGYDSEKSMKMLPNVLNLAAAGGMDLALASDMVTDASSALGLSMDETTDLINKMAVTASKSNTSVSQLGDAILTVGGTAKSMKGGTTELSAALGILADNGTKASEGGTALRNVLNTFSSAKFEKTFGALGVSAYDADGNMRLLKDTLADMNAVMSDMTTQEKDKLILSAFNKYDLKNVNALLATSSERWEQLTVDIENAAGAANDMADTQLDNLAGDITLFQSAVEGAQIAVADRLTPTLRKFTQFGSKAVSEMSEAFRDRGLKGAVEAAHKEINQNFGKSATAIFAVEDATKAAMAAFVTYKAVMKTTEMVKGISILVNVLNGATAAQEALNTAGLANPFVLIVTTATAATAAIKSFIDTETDLIDETGKAFSIYTDAQKETINDINNFIKEYESLVSDYDTEIVSITKNADNVQRLINKLYELDEAEKLTNVEKQEMQAYIDSLNASIPSLNLQIDEETGHLKEQKNAIDDLIKSWGDEEKLKNYREELISLTNKQTEAEEELNKAAKAKVSAENDLNRERKNLELYQKRYDDYLKNHSKWYQQDGNIISGYKILIENQTKAVEDAEIAYSNADNSLKKMRDTQKSYGDQIENTKNNIGALVNTDDEAVKSIENTTESVTRLTGAFTDADGSFDHFGAVVYGNLVQLDKDTSEYVAAQLDYYDELYAKQKSAIENSVDLFKEFDLTYTTTYQDMYTAAESNAQALDIWTDHVEALQNKVDEGLLSQQLLDDLKAMGLGSLDEMDILVKSTDTKLKSYSDKWQEAYDLQTEATDAAMSDTKKTIENDLNDILGITGAKIDDFKKAFNELGVNADKGIVEGIKSHISEIEKAGKSVSDTAYDSAFEEGEYGSPSKKFIQLGKWAAEGYAEGIKENIKIAINAVTDLGQATIDALKDKLGIASPSKIFRELGGYSGDGFALGFDDSESAVIRAAAGMADSAYNAVGEYGAPNYTGTLSTPYNTARVEKSTAGTAMPETLHITLMLENGQTVADWLFPFMDAIQGRETRLSARGY